MPKMLEYIEEFHKEQISQILNAESRSEVPFRYLPVDLKVLRNQNIQLFQKVKGMQIWKEKEKWTKALMKAQERFITKSLTESKMYDYNMLKENFPVGFVNAEETLKEDRVFEQLWRIVTVKGNVFRSRERGKMEISREFKCRKCKKTTIIYTDRLTQFHFDIPNRCTLTRDCKGTMFNTEDSDKNEANLEHVIDFQEIKVQVSEKGNSPIEWLTVELDEELVESCFIGDQVTICGTLEMRSVKGINDHTLVLRAVSVIVEENKHRNNIDHQEVNLTVRYDWETDLNRFNGDESKIKDEMVSAVAPEIEGLAIIKLGLLLVLCSGGKINEAGENSQKKQASSTTREICHFLMVGDPGLGKSRILKAASEISANAIRTVGYAATTAGLTAHCFGEGGVTQIEAGALVKANNGICCIDEINLLSKEHRGSIHEVMELQKISMAKAGIRIDILTKCSIIAGMNQKNSTQPIEAKNLTMEQSLLSRFDLIFEFENLYSRETDTIVANHIIDGLKKIDTNSNWNHDRLGWHIQVAKEIRVEITEDAQEVLKNYFTFCRQNEEIDPCRRSYRLWNSLERLTICHAKLMLRQKAGIEDAVTVVMLMESTWTFGHLIDLPPVVRSKVPLGLTRALTAEILDRLNLNDLLEKKLSQKMFETQNSDELELIDKTIVDDIFADEDDEIDFKEEKEENQLDDSTCKKVSTQELFSTQANNFQDSSQSLFPFTQSSPKFQEARSFNETLNESSFKSPTMTSTQSLSKSSPINKSVGSPGKQQPKETTVGKLENDENLFAKLNSLVALYTDKPSGSENVESKESSLSSPASLKQPLKSASTFPNKLKKFKFSEETLQKSEDDTKESLKENTSTEVLNDKTQLIDKEVEEMDFFDL